MLSRIFSTAGFLFSIILLSGCNDEKVLDNLTQEQANQVLSVLQQHNISAHKNGNLKSGYAITVSPTENTAALSIINQYQLPWSANIQIGHAFPDSSLVSSPGAEQARIRSLQEQRLEQSLRIIDHIVNARVHISYPYNANDLVTRQSTSHIGILISYRGEIDKNIFISQIKNFIKNSIDDVSYENISVVLFNAPVIQYTQPVEISHSISDSWIMVFSGLGLLLSTCFGYFFYMKMVKNKSSNPDLPDNTNNYKLEQE